MANVFSGSEIVGFGIEIERNGRDFYNTLAAKAQDAKAKDVFKFLEREEEKHIAVFRKILESVKEYEPPETYVGEYFAYMTMLAGEYVFTQADKGKEVAKKITNDKEAIDLGIKFEKESIIFYEGMKKAVPEIQAGIVEKLVEQENAHLFKLLKLKSGI
ncbi:MAG: ferritin family protein [Candidatus Omnitrophota bacterium]